MRMGGGVAPGALNLLLAVARLALMTLSRCRAVQVSLDGRDLKSLDLRWLRQQMSLVSQVTAHGACPCAQTCMHL